MHIQKKIFGIISILLIALIFGAAPASAASTATKDARSLEIVYPEIPGAITPTTISTGLPEYIKYIFSLSIYIVGFIIFGSLVYAGFKYFTSMGSPEKFSEAKSRIFSAILGAAILLGAFLIFNTINPQLVILDMVSPDVLEPVVEPGVYICNYNAVKVYPAIKQYMSDKIEDQIKGAEIIKDVMKNNTGSCPKVIFSTNLTTPFERTSGTINTIFIIPEKKSVYVPASASAPATTKKEWYYDYGVVFHEKDNRQGQCQITNIFETMSDGSAAGKDINDKLRDIRFSFGKARSLTLFTKPKAEPSMENYGVTLYECLNYNENGLCPQGVTTPNYLTVNMDPGKYYQDTTKDAISSKGLIRNVRSMSIDPTDSYFAILFSGSNFDGNTCEVISNDDLNLLDNPIGKCGSSCNTVSSIEQGTETQIKKCQPCMQSMKVIKGQVLL